MAVYLQERGCNVLGYTTFNVNKTLQLFVCFFTVSLSYSISISTHTYRHTRPHTHNIVNNALGN